jgi:hypothetical protein
LFYTACLDTLCSSYAIHIKISLYNKKALPLPIPKELPLFLSQKQNLPVSIEVKTCPVLIEAQKPL